MLLRVFSRTLTADHYAHIISPAMFCKLVLLLFSILPPFFITYFTKSFWLRHTFYQEQPDVRFTRDFMVFLHGPHYNTALSWSTFQNLNLLLGSQARIPLTRHQEVDFNRDNIVDYFDFSADFPLKTGEDVTHVSLLLFHNVNLHSHVQLTMQSVTYLDYSAASPGNSMHFSGELKLKQRNAFPSYGKLTTYATPLLNASSPYADDYQVKNIITDYMSRNITTYIENLNSIWQYGPALDETFKISVRINFPPQTFFYQTGVWEVLKFAWVQYISLLFIFLFISNSFSYVLFVYFILPTKVRNPIKPHTS